MDIFDPTQRLLESAMRGANTRQTALAQNLANANTPNYRRVDVDFHSALKDAWSQAESSSGQDDGDPDNDPTAALQDVTFSATAQQGDSGTTRVDGSGVDVDVETSALAANGLEYQALAAVAKTRNSIITSAIGH
jgi:flagellar basal-body rod protein FlgB